MPLLKQQILRFANGERFPLLTDPEGYPVFLPNVYLVAMRRSTNVSSNTLVRDGRGIMHLYAWAVAEGIDLEERFREGEFLSLGEVESLRRACCWLYKTLTAQCEESSRRRIIPIPGVEQVESETLLVRMISIGAYLDWMAILRIERVGETTSTDFARLESSRNRMVTAFAARRPNNASRNVVGHREGLSEENQNRLLDAIMPLEIRSKNGSILTAKGYTWAPNNPWCSPPIRFRNSLMILVLYYLGIRSGELLGLKIGDLNFEENTLYIRRAPDDPNDPRLFEPNTKTLDRILPVDRGLMAMLHLYIQETRRKWVPRKRDHLYLWVTASGKPLSMSGIKKMWLVLRNAIPELPADFSPHTLRHNWNDLFSKKMDMNNVPEAKEQQQRSYQMGWRPTSDTAATYTRRHTRNASNKAAIELQRETWDK